MVCFEENRVSVSWEKNSGIVNLSESSQGKQCVFFYFLSMKDYIDLDYHAVWSVSLS